MGNCLVMLGLKSQKSYKESGIEHGPVTLLLVGLDNSGKTTAAKGILGESLDNVAPTLGFVPEVLEYRGCEVTIFDLGGGSKLRPVWTKYFAEVHGVIFVIDSSAPQRLQECRAVLLQLLAHRRISGKPVLILANKQDIEGAMDEMDIVESLKIEEMVNKYKCPTRVETCSAVTLHNSKPDKPIADGFRWLVDTIVVHYSDLQVRILKDMEREWQKTQRELEERKERIRHQRAERERQERLATEGQIKGDEVAGGDEDDTEVVVVTEAATVKQDVEGVASSLPALNKNNTDADADDECEEDSDDDCNDNVDVTGEADFDPQSSEAQELRELGFTSATSLAELASTTDDADELSDSGRGDTNREVHVPLEEEGRDRHQSKPLPDLGGRRSPNLQVHRSESGRSADKGSHRIIVVSSPTTSPSSHSLTTVVSPTHTSPPFSDRDNHNDSGFPTTPATTASQVTNGAVLLQLGDEDALDGCGGFVPIDSDDELYNMDQRQHSITTYVRSQLELESLTARAPKKKSFLKRYHKTVPADSTPNGGLSVT